MPEILWLNNIFLSKLHSLRNDCKGKIKEYKGSFPESTLKIKFLTIIINGTQFRDFS